MFHAFRSLNLGPIFFLAAAVAINATTNVSVVAEESVCLKYDDGTQETKKSMSGSGHAVRFECPDDEQWYLKSLAVHGSRYGSPKAPRDKFSILVASEDLKQFLKAEKPYSLFERGQEKWVKFDIVPVKVPKTFQVALYFNPTRTKGVYVGIDENSTPTHSMTVVADDLSKNKSGMRGDWMIQAFVTKVPQRRSRSLANASDNAKDAAKQEAEADAKILGKARSRTLKHDAETMDGYQNIRGAAYTVQFETPKDVEAYVWQTQIFASQFGGQHDSEAVSGDVYVLDENRKIISRSTFPYSLTKQEKQWISIPTLPTRVHGKFYISIDTHGTKTKGMYMGFAEGNEGKLASTDEIGGESIKPGDWSEKFADKQWLMRVKIADRPVVYGPAKAE